MKKEELIEGLIFTNEDSEFVYKLICLVNQKIYIGRTSNLDNRIKTHFTKLRNGNHINQFLQDDFNRYGEKNFIFELIAITEDDEDSKILEKKHINENKQNCYNIVDTEKQSELTKKGQFYSNRKCGRPKADPEKLEYAFHLYKQKKQTVKEITAKTGVSRTSLYRFIDERNLEAN